MNGLLAAAGPIASSVLVAVLILTPAWMALTAPTDRRHRRRNRR